MSELRTPREPYDRKAGATKPATMDEVRGGGWAEVCIGPWSGDDERIVFGVVVAIRHAAIYIRVADEVCSFAKTGLRDGDLIQVELEDIFGSEFSSYAIELEAQRVRSEVERPIMDAHREEFEQRYPQYAVGSKEWRDTSNERWHEYCCGASAARQEFIDDLIRSGRVGAP